MKKLYFKIECDHVNNFVDSVLVLLSYYSVVCLCLPTCDVSMCDEKSVD